jgi:hypothetical protein
MKENSDLTSKLPICTWKKNVNSEPPEASMEWPPNVGTIQVIKSLWDRMGLDIREIMTHRKVL